MSTPFAQSDETITSQLEIPNISETINIDADFNEESWRNALIIDLDIVNSPWNNTESPVKTQVKLIENGKFIYIAFTASDPEPEKIQAFLGDRDSRWSDDLVGIKLDTSNNRRLNYSLFVNPLGVQNDSIFNEMTGEDNRLWDGIWQSYGKVTSQGYQVEIAIPYNMLNFNDNDGIKTWAIELVRIYPRDNALRISHVPLDRNNACWLCQYPEIKGFKDAEASKNLLVTPTIVANSEQQRDIYQPNSDWTKENNIEAGLDLRWGINANNLVNLTINPDFSTVETDEAQLSINKTFSLFYDEKRPFFLDNADYFSSNYDLVYTRNIADPDYGAKFTGNQGKHTYAAFMANDTATTFISPGNLSSSITSLDQESHSGALRYRYDHTGNLSFGAISTLRSSEDYNNYLFGLDGKYRFDDSNSILFQALNSSSEYSFNEINEDLSDQAYKLNLIHNSEFWQANAEHQYIGEEFRADLGFMPKADFTKTKASVKRLFYNDDDTSVWQDMGLSITGELQQNTNKELIERSVNATFNGFGPKLSFYEISLIHADKVGLRHDSSNLAIDGNTTIFTENQLILYGKFQPTTNTTMDAEFIFGDKIDYSNNQLGDINQLTASLTWNINKHLKTDITHTYSQLSASGDTIYTANLTDLRISYQFNVYSYIKLTMVYSDIDTTETEQALSTQFIYAYKLNPQTVFFLGYSDNSYQDINLPKLEREQKTFFSKISYAWMP